MAERRTGSRRKLPFVRSAILQDGESTHLAILGDLGPEGAFLRTRLNLPAGRKVTLRLVLPGDGRAVVLPAEVVWSGERFDPASGHPAGLAIRFVSPPAEVREKLSRFSDTRGTGQRAFARVEYKVLVAAALDEHELNALGREGWALAAAVPAEGGLRMAFRRRA